MGSADQGAHVAGVRHLDQREQGSPCGRGNSVNSANIVNSANCAGYYCARAEASGRGSTGTGRAN